MITCRRSIHCIGIGGAGMSGLAETLVSMGCTVTGSDQQETAVTRHLQQLGISVQYHHEPQLIRNADLIIYSSAIRPTAPERLWALQNNVVQMRRAEAIGDIMRSAYCIGIAGTHGKTTTTALTGHLLGRAGLNPSVIVGGTTKDSGANAVVGNGRLMVVEADEFDRSFLVMYPTVAVITNVEAEHLDCYGDFASVKEAFVSYAQRIPFYGSVVVCADDPGVREILPEMRGRVVTYGFDSSADFRATAPVFTAMGSCCMLKRSGKPDLELTLSIPGHHNVLNALGALAACAESGVAVESVIGYAAEFTGVKRRFEHIGNAKGVSVIDDYAHHPAEIRATMSAARNAGFKRIVVVFQPHLYTRTRDLLAGFIEALSEADIVVVCAIYRSREEAIPGVSAEAIVAAIRNRGHRAAFYASEPSAVPEIVMPLLDKGDVVITMGAGDIWQQGEALMRRLSHG